MRLAALDIGTNSIHMIVVKVRPDLSFEVIDREKDMVRLGAGGLDGRSITPTAMAAGRWPSRSRARRSSNIIVTGGLGRIVIGCRPFCDVGGMGRDECSGSI